MASDDQWPPVASAGRGTPKFNGSKRNVKESQQKVLSVVNELFGSALEPDVILSVVQTCNWELQPSIEGLITLTETVDNPLVWNSAEKPENMSTTACVAALRSGGLKGGNKATLENDSTIPEASSDRRESEPTLTSKSDRSKKGGAKNRMGSFCGNIAKLKSSIETNNSSSNVESTLEKIAHKQETPITTIDDLLFDGILNYGASEERKIIDDTTKSPIADESSEISRPTDVSSSEKASPWPRTNQRVGQSSSSPTFSPPMNKNRNRNQQKFLETKAAAEDKEFNRERKSATIDSKSNPRKPESESLCGLKVQYRVGGMDSSSDDDADVVIEDEASNYKVDLAPSTSINVSQFLSPSTQTAPRRTQPEFHMITTPSPPQTPQRSAHVLALNRIKSATENGYRIMILLRGLSGSGKSTLAKSIVASTVGGNPAAYVFNTDDFFVTLGRGSYHFDPSRLQEAHSTNHKRVWMAVKEGRSPIIVDNTNIEAWEMRPYLAMAVEYGYIVEILEPDTAWAQNINQLAKKNVHDVPKTKIRDQANRYERIIDAKSLFDRYSLKYSSMNEPPQLRRVPPIVSKVVKPDAAIADIKSNWSNHGKNDYVLSSHDIETMQNIDETHSGAGMVSELASVAPDIDDSSRDPETAKNFRETSYDAYMQELQNSDDESFELVEGSASEHYSDNVGKKTDGNDIFGSHRSLTGGKFSPIKNLEESAGETKNSSPDGSQQIFGAIGSERKGSLSVCSSIGNLDSEKTETKSSSPTGLPQTLGAIGSERKGSSSVGSSVGNLAGEKPETKDFNDSQQPLGAIGSERKGSFSVNSSATTSVLEKIENDESERTDNVLTQCWDFTLISGRSKIHSRHSIEDLPRSAFFARPKTNEPENVAEIAAALGEIVDEKLDKFGDDGISKVEGVVITEIFDDFEAKDSAADSFTDDGLLNTDEIKETFVEASVERDDDRQLNNDELSLGDATTCFLEALKKAADIEIESSGPREAPNPENFPTSRTTDRSVEKIDETVEFVANDATDVSESTANSTTTFGSFLKMLKTSILGGTETTESTDLDENERPHEPGSLIHETSVHGLQSAEREDDPSSDTVDSPNVSGESSNPDSPPEIVANDVTEVEEKLYGDISTNPFRDEMMKSQREETVRPDADSLTDNINSISWKESPFPIDATKIPVIPPVEDKKCVERSEASTNTTYYDFNVDYVGGTSEPGYRELVAIGRSINDGTIVAKPERPPLKLMLDKSSMTNEVNILATDVSIEKDDDATDEVRKLVELFPHKPVNTLEAFYKHQCKGNFDWAVEVLLEDVPSDFTMEDRQTKSPNDDVDPSTSPVAESTDKCDGKNERSKQRSNTPSLKNRRQRSKDFRSFSIEYVDDRSSGSGEPSVNEEDAVPTKDEEEIILQSFYDNAACAARLPSGNDEISEASSESTGSGHAYTEDDADEVLELDFGRQFVSQLEKTFGNADYTLPDDFKTVIRIKKSMAEELHSLWIHSMCDQLSDRQIKLDDMIAKDEEMARALDREETVRSVEEPVVPNLDEIMAMEMALASKKNVLKEKITRETPNDLASRLTRRMLCESWPGIDPETLTELLRAHDGNFEETCKTIESSTDCLIGSSFTLEKQRSLLDSVKKETRNREIFENLENTVIPEQSVNSDVMSDVICNAERLSYEEALARSEDARNEAQKQFSLRVENYNKAAAAYGKGHPGVAAYYSQMAKLHSENSKVANAEAADAFVLAQICRSDDTNTLDLHCMFVPEALRALETFIDFHSKKLGKSNKKSSTLYIITGRGARSNNGFSKIKPAVSKRLTSKNIRFTDENAGCLRVTLSKKHCTLE